MMTMLCARPLCPRLVMPVPLSRQSVRTRLLVLAALMARAVGALLLVSQFAALRLAWLRRALALGSGVLLAMLNSYGAVLTPTCSLPFRSSLITRDVWIQALR